MKGRAPTAQKRPTLNHLQNILYRIHGIRVIFKVPHNSPMPIRGVQVKEQDYFDGERYISEFYHYLQLVAPDVPYEIVAVNGRLNPHGNTKVKTVRFHVGADLTPKTSKKAT